MIEIAHNVAQREDRDRGNRNEATGSFNQGDGGTCSRRRERHRAPPDEQAQRTDVSLPRDPTHRHGARVKNHKERPRYAPRQPGPSNREGMWTKGKTRADEHPRLSQDKHDRRVAEKLCFDCGGPGHWAKGCPAS